jgi:hypothetical protein
MSVVTVATDHSLGTTERIPDVLKGSNMKIEDDRCYEDVVESAEDLEWSRRHGGVKYTEPEFYNKKRTHVWVKVEYRFADDLDEDALDTECIGLTLSHDDANKLLDSETYEQAMQEFVVPKIREEFADEYGMVVWRLLAIQLNNALDRFTREFSAVEGGCWL